MQEDTEEMREGVDLRRRRTNINGENDPQPNVST